MAPEPTQDSPSPAAPGCVCTSGSDSTRPSALPAALIDFSSAEGRSRLMRALAVGTASPFCLLVAQMQTQPFPAACGLTSLAVVLNAAGLDPRRVWQQPWRWYEERFLFCCSGEDAVRASGITLDEFACIARCHALQPTVHRAPSADALRAVFAEELSDRRPGTEKRFLVASFSRLALGQTGSGHFSPVAAWDEESDSVLVLDTARFKYPPFWVPVTTLAAAMRDVDPETGLARGVVVLVAPEEVRGDVEKLT